MKLRSCLGKAIFASVIAAAMGLWAQGFRMVTIDPRGENGLVRLSPVDAAAQYNFAKIFEIPRFQEYQPFALLLTNHSGQAIVALTIRWTGTSAGQSGVYDYSTDSLGMQVGGGSASSIPLPERSQPAGIPARLGSGWSSAEGPVVLAAGGRMLVAPGMCVKEDVTRQRTSPGAASGMPAALKDAETISATIDAAVLEDGRVLGPDESRTIEELQARKACIDGLLSAVTAAERNGQDVLEVLRKLADARPTRDSGPETMRQGRLARTLMMSRQWRERLEQLAALRLPNFHR